MIRLFLFAFKLAVFSVVVLVIGQISVGGSRITDHVHNVLMHARVQRPVHWVSKTFNFLEGHRAVHAGTESHTNDPEHNESDRDRLSGLLKKK